MRLLLVPALSMAVAGCGGAPPVSMTCRTSPDPRLPGVPATAAITLRNDTAETITIAGETIPWLYRHAARFSAPGFSDPHVIADPERYYEPVILPPGESAGGEVALHDRLVDSFGRGADQIPGTHEVEVRARLELDPRSTRRRHAEAQCRFPFVVAPEP